jgi:formate hydrogenlyase subunit 6/NADH:ubiquinone oxidoreductase subunit I
MARRRLDLRFPPNRATRPVTYHLVKDYDLTPNILRARIEPGQQGRLLLEVTGRKADIDAAVAFLGMEGIEVAAAASDIVLDEERCVVCGLCTAVCKPDALSLSSDGSLTFDKDACVYCEACVVACPRRAITLEF